MKALLLICLLPLQLFSQDITGIWTGFLHTNGNDIPFELAISQNKEAFTGYALTVFTFNGTDNIGIKSIKLQKKNRNISLEDDEMIFNNYSTPPRRIKLYSDLFLKVEDSVMTLTGSFNTRTLDLRSQDKSPFVGTIQLKKQNIFIETKLISKLDELNLLNALSFVPPQFRKNEAVAAVAEESEKPLIQKEKEKEIVAAQPLKNQATFTRAKSENLPPSTITLAEPDPAPPQVAKEKQISSGARMERTEKNQAAFSPANPHNLSPSTLTLTEPGPAPPQFEKEKQIPANYGVAAVEKSQPAFVSTRQGKLAHSPITLNGPEKAPPQVEKQRQLTDPSGIATAQLKRSSNTSLTQKSKVPAASATPPVIPKAAPPPAAALTERKTDVLQSIPFSSDSLVLSLFDNGEVDGDTVSVVLNGKVIIARQGLTTKAIRTTIHTTQGMGDSMQLIMYAENLGAIPPNTGLLIIQDGDQRYEIRFAGDMQKSSAVILRRKR
jgi:hypothetical protein